LKVDCCPAWVLDPVMSSRFSVVSDCGIWKDCETIHCLVSKQTLTLVYVFFFGKDVDVKGKLLSAKHRAETKVVGLLHTIYPMNSATYVQYVESMMYQNKFHRKSRL